MENVSSDLPLSHEEIAEKYKQACISQKLGEELKKAYEHVNSLPVMVPAGFTVDIKEFADVKKLVDDKPEGVMFSGRG